jgi:3-oxoacyl-[acyl-carrier-protein] synthase II
VRGAVDGRQAAVTGVGVVSVCGTGADAFWAGLSAPAEPRRVREVPDWDPSPWFARKDARHSDRFEQFAVAAADLALLDAGVHLAQVDPERCGVQVGTGIGGVATFEEAVRVLDGRGADRVSPYTARMIMPNAAAAAVSMRWGLRGPVETITTACAAGTHSVAAGARMLVDGTCDLVLAGASDASLRGTTVAGFTNASAMSRSGVSRPFDRARDGFVAAEGAAVLVLEPLDAALARGARVYCVLAGAASNADAYDMTAPSPGGRGAEACMRLALRDAGLRPEDVAHVNAHGTSTLLNDAAEAAAVHRLTGGRSAPVTSIKGVTGHALGAAGALEAAAVCLSFAHRALPPTAGFAEPDEDTAVLDVVREPRPWEPGPVVSNSFGFGGHNGTVVLVPA